jgi:SAM-dependent methyltransferase
MSVFDAYAHYYDLLYKDKDYEGETAYIATHIHRFAPKAKRIIELGCGTGHHAMLLAKRGYVVHGVDLSPTMLETAHARTAQLPPTIATRLSFSQGDVCNVRVGHTFDIALSLFHVVSYHITNQDLLAAFDTAAQHLIPGGMFLFDVWYGPAVLTDRPAVRIKRLEDDVIRVVRLAEPKLHPSQNIVDVNYHVIITDKNTGGVKEVRESHHMRYLFQPEIAHLLAQSGFKMAHAEEWMTAKPLGFDTWGACFVAIKA